MLQSTLVVVSAHDVRQSGRYVFEWFQVHMYLLLKQRKEG